MQKIGPDRKVMSDHRKVKLKRKVRRERFHLFPWIFYDPVLQGCVAQHKKNEDE